MMFCVLCIVDARYQVLDVMDLCMPMPRGDVKENGPAFGK